MNHSEFEKERTMAENIFRLLIRTICLVMILIFLIQMFQGVFFGRSIANFIKKNLIQAGSILMDEYEEIQEKALENLLKTKTDNTDNILTNSYQTMAGIAMIIQRMAPTEDTDGDLRIDLPKEEDREGLASSYYQIGEDVDPDSPEVKADVAFLSAMSKYTEDYFDFIPYAMDISIYTKHDVILHTNGFESKVAREGEKHKDFLRSEMKDGRASLDDVFGNLFLSYKDPYVEQEGVKWSMAFERDGETYGVVSVVIPKSVFQEVISSDLPYEDDICCVIYGNSTIVIFSTEEEGIFKLGEFKVGQKSYLEKQDPDVAKAITKAVESKPNGCVPIKMKKPIAGSKKAWVYYREIEGFHWTIAIIRPDSVWDQAMKSFRGKLKHMQEEGRTLAANFILAVMLTVGLSLAFGGVLSFVLSRRYSRRLAEPIVTLSGKVEQLNGENLQFTWEDKIQDEETRVLVNAFSKMTERVNRDIERIRDYTAQKERLDAELGVAARIQQGILPVDSEAFENRDDFAIRAIMEPAREVGGDLYDFFLIDDDHLAVVVGDVSGKGIPAGLFMTVTKTLLKHELMANSNSPGKILALVNDRLCEGNSMMMFVTLWLGVLELSTGRLTSVNAGHDYPMMRLGDSGFREIQEENFLALGVMEGAEYPENEVILGPRDALFIYTDGVPEAMNEEGELFGIPRMLAALNETAEGSPDEIVAHMGKRLREYVKDAEQFDDITMLCVKIKEG